MIRCLHGFLGTGDDWAPFSEAFRSASGMRVECPDLFAEPSNEPLADFAVRFTRPSGSVLIGYSMGGRIALRSLLRRPDAFRAAVIISAGLGIADPDERRRRIDSDASWARRFEVEPWPQLIAAWNEQSVFGGSALPMPREESARLNRDALAAALRSWSPGRDARLGSSDLQKVSCPVLWVAGERDSKYAAEARAAVLSLPRGAHWLAPGAGHRVPWEAPDTFRERVSNFLADALSR